MRFLGSFILHDGTPLRPPTGLLEQVHELDVAGLRGTNIESRVALVVQNRSNLLGIAVCRYVYFVPHRARVSHDPR